MTARDDSLYRPCAGIMLLNAQGQVFVGQRKDKLSDAWQMPQGGIENPDNPYACALRELEEETGLTADKVEKIAECEGWLYYDLPDEIRAHVHWGQDYKGQRQKWYLLRFTGQDSDIDLEAGGEWSEFLRWRWISPQDLPNVIVPFKREVYVQVLELFEGHLGE